MHYLHVPPVVVFLRNLSLLQLDELPDRPDLSTRIFAGGQHTLRQRVKGVEWALYHLFVIWDPEGTRNKLRPFFPPLEPLQSVNLRAALFRALSEARKNGDWGRETVVRKTMLDDCQGDKCEELLATFSTAVLRKVIASSSERLMTTPAMRLSTAKTIPPEDRDILVSLILAYRSSLNAMSEKRAHLRRNHDRFAHLLDVKTLELARRARDKPPPLLADVSDFEGLAQEVKGNWLGSEEWVDMLLAGGVRNCSDGMLELPFRKVWSGANREEDPDKPSVTDLVLGLEERLSQQRHRLRRWQMFHVSVGQNGDAQRQANRDRRENQTLVFQKHQLLTMSSLSKAVRQSAVFTAQDARYQSILSSMNEALVRITGEAKPAQRPRLEPPENNTLTSSPHITITTPAVDNVTGLSPPGSPLCSEHAFLADSPTVLPAVHSPTETISKFESGQSANKVDVKAAVALLERTRQSMSLLPPQPTSRPRKSVTSQLPRLSQQFPVNQFETRRTSSCGSVSDRSGATTPRDDLFSEDADYASVFKSRPRIATSPHCSPTVHVGIADSDGPASSAEPDLGTSPLASTTMKSWQRGS
ncbi:HAUS augmin-like complex subunit 6 N-terminus domain containing protein [Elaphomyces granulatus]